ncbi:hypothetical protein ACEWY4_020422 [Coilia grayii]|uniref:C-type lectin domain-containing protein n=1 Tax=Coilia grayii TaxID=363190 RepID=A0ABD1JCK9_9TELE
MRRRRRRRKKDKTHSTRCCGTLSEYNQSSTEPKAPALCPGGDPDDKRLFVDVKLCLRGGCGGRTIGRTGPRESWCGLAAACLGLLCAALFLGITSLGIHYHRSSQKSMLLRQELQALQEVNDLLRKENNALRTSQGAPHKHSHGHTATAASRDQAQRHDALTPAQSVAQVHRHCTQKSVHLHLKLQSLQRANNQLTKEKNALQNLQGALHKLHSHVATVAREEAQSGDPSPPAQFGAQEQKDCAHLADTNQRLWRELEELMASSNRLHSAHSQLQRAESRLEVRRWNLTKAYTRLQAERHKLSGTVERLRRANAELSADRLKLLAENSRLSEAWGLLAERCAALEGDRDTLKRTVTRMGCLPVVEHRCPHKHTETEERKCEACPRGWVAFSSHCYFFSTEVRTWSSGRVHCLQQGGDLVVIDTAEEQEFLHRQTSQYLGPAQRYWIGLSDEAAEGVWAWVDGTLPIWKRFWVRGSGGLDADRDCASMLKESSSGRTWREDICTETFRWICESTALV